MHAKMYALGSKYGIQPPQTAALDRFTQAAVQECQSAHFLEALRIAYNMTPVNDKGLRDAFIQVLIQHQEVILAKSEFEEWVRSNDDLGWHLLFASKAAKAHSDA